MRALLSEENQHLNQRAQKQNQITELRVTAREGYEFTCIEKQVHTPDSLHLAGICTVISSQIVAPLGENQGSIHSSLQADRKRQTNVTEIVKSQFKSFESHRGGCLCCFPSHQPW